MNFFVQLGGLCIYTRILEYECIRWRTTTCVVKKHYEFFKI